MPRFNVVLPITGQLEIEVEAENEEDAIELAEQEASINPGGHYHTPEWYTPQQLEEATLLPFSMDSATATLAE